MTAGPAGQSAEGPSSVGLPSALVVALTAASCADPNGICVIFPLSAVARPSPSDSSTTRGRPASIVDVVVFFADDESSPELHALPTSATKTSGTSRRRSTRRQYNCT